MSSVLDKINSPDHLRILTNEALKKLCCEIREFLITNVSKTGGHLASNLGVVELTIALHMVYDSPKDKIIWDVGHQSYVHKILTGRKDQFDKLRKLNGLSGFPKREESPHDIFNTGHSSTSISAALGIAKARDILKEDYSVVAVIGDGALTGGMAYEALNDAGRSLNNFTVILNDNEMSISKNVGAMSKYLSKIRLEPAYTKAKEEIDELIHKIPRIGESVAKTINKAKNTIKYALSAGAIFEELGFNYLGPIDGHNLDELTNVLRKAKDLKGPNLIHVITQKGKGYNHAENNPSAFHGVSPFCIETGEVINSNTKPPDFSQIFGEALVKLAETNNNIVAVTAAMPEGTGLTKFGETYPNRFFDVGIAEQHAVTFCAGLATNGLTPVIAVYSSFLQRAYDQVIHDVALQNLHVVFCIDRAGIVGNDGETHQGIYDLSYLTHIPNMTILAPKDFEDLKSMLDFAINKYNGPIAIRYPRGSMKTLVSKDSNIEYGKSEVLVNGNNATLLACGSMLKTVIEVSDRLKEHGITCDVINARFIKPLDMETIVESISKTKNLYTFEDNTIVGGFGSYVLNELNILGINDIKVKSFGFPDEFIKQGSKDEIFIKYGLDTDTLSQKIIECYKSSGC